MDKVYITTQPPRVRWLCADIFRRIFYVFLHKMSGVRFTGRQVARKRYLMGMAPGIVRMHEHVTFRDFLAPGEVCNESTDGTCIFCTCYFTHGIPRLLLPACSSTVLRISPNFSLKNIPHFFVFLFVDPISVEDRCLFLFYAKPGTLKDFADGNALIAIIGQGKNFQSQIGGNCDWKFFLHHFGC